MCLFIGMCVPTYKTTEAHIRLSVSECTREHHKLTLMWNT